MMFARALRFVRNLSAVAFFATVASTVYLSLLQQIDPRPRILDAIHATVAIWQTLADQLVAAPITIGFAVILAMMGAGVLRSWLA